MEAKTAGCPMHVFAYGSLMYDSVWSRVVAGSYERTVSMLRGYKRRLLRGRVYPALLPGGPDDIVNGVVYLDVLKEDILRLDLFEGELYRRDGVLCQIREDTHIPAQTFLLKPEHYHLAIDRNWEPEESEK
jgi:gamma-glutamylcyclotransferase (GGCT)/AIG2-like uncharacterized protein YtfP